ncbi:uncharacterized protein SPPG_03993 [Spizellomyces punctatus DAOM BR117]|uniref:choline-phosphate cytidylyltransferase n=1 Tax=Spizellomyces punctatus (strain DAOM BR117) TaxID=645134 RepID=A0A0L0HIL3_SPIPD|nr:uncharacterized protein SPPG_03993 [Spizellomyces punctatus DAOM BR117]KND00893.1 hypothetical protein SPPG_03993 [Spizellomyces punctatus DAOM BR117]|eukprot:XP_016608932.1 hypothetical protein SPPG_03993 [Spizellomyces punctatus DAOM BR117]
MTPPKRKRVASSEPNTVSPSRLYPSLDTPEGVDDKDVNSSPIGETDIERPTKSRRKSDAVKHVPSVMAVDTKMDRDGSTPDDDSSSLGSGAELALHMVDASRVGESGLPANLQPPPTDRPVRIYCDGIWDLFHFGHAKALEQAKKVFPNVELLVGVCNDQVTHSKKGKTVMRDTERYESLRHCKWVDEVVPDAPWVIDQEFLDKHRIDYVAHDDIPYKSGDHDDVYAFVKKAGRFIPTRRTEGVSTSDLITRIVRDYDAYVRRNLERGVSPKELNISFFKEKEIRMKSRIGTIKQSLQSRLQQGESSIRRNWEDTKNDLPHKWKNTLEYWEDMSSELVRGFIGLFGQEGLPRLLFGRRNRSRGGTPTSSPSESPKRRWLFGSPASSTEDEDENEEVDEDEEGNSNGSVTA